MALESYNLIELVRRIRDEFGISDTDSRQDPLIIDKVNEGMSMIVRRRPNWPWQRRVVSIDVSAETSGTANVTQGSRTVTGLTIPVSARDMLTFSTGGEPANTYMVTSVSGQTATLEHQYLGASATGTVVRKRTGYIQLPDDFLKMDTAAPLEDLSDLNSFKYVTLNEWEKRRRSVHQPSWTNVYTIGPDPIGSTERLYLYLFPPLSELRVLRCAYYADPPRLQFDTDVPMMPRNDRPVVLYYAMNLYAITRTDPRANLYYSIAEREMVGMLLRYDLSDDEPNRDVNRWRERHVDVTTDPAAPDFIGGG